MTRNWLTNKQSARVFFKQPENNRLNNERSFFLSFPRNNLLLFVLNVKGKLRR